MPRLTEGKESKEQSIEQIDTRRGKGIIRWYCKHTVLSIVMGIILYGRAYPYHCCPPSIGIVSKASRLKYVEYLTHWNCFRKEQRIKHMQRIMLSNQDCSLLLKTMFRGFTGTNDAGKAGKESSFFISPIPTPPLGRTGKIRHSSAAPVGEA